MDWMNDDEGLHNALSRIFDESIPPVDPEFELVLSMRYALTRAKELSQNCLGDRISILFHLLKHSSTDTLLDCGLKILGATAAIDAPDLVDAAEE